MCLWTKFVFPTNLTVYDGNRLNYIPCYCYVYDKNKLLYSLLSFHMYEVDQLVPYPAPMCLVLSVVLALLPGAECTVITA